MYGFFDVPGAMAAVWPVAMGVLILLIMRRWKPANAVQRIACGFGGALLFLLAVSPRDPATGAVIPNAALHALAAAMGVSGFICVMCTLDWE